MTDDVEISNFLLRSLPTHVANAVVGAAEFVHLDLKEHIIYSNKPIEFVDFPESGVMSLLTPMENDLLVEIATIGREGMVGIPLIMGVPSIRELAFCQVPGTAWRIGAAPFRKLLVDYPELLAVCQRYSIILFDQVARNTGCNRTHTIEERCARWLLMTHDRSGSDEFILTQEFLATMLGVSRTGVNLAAGILSKAKLITYVRGRIRVLDRAGLEDICCDCYFAMRNYYSSVMQLQTFS